MYNDSFDYNLQIEDVYDDTDTAYLDVEYYGYNFPRFDPDWQSAYIL